MSSRTRLPPEPFALNALVGDAQTSTTIDALVRHEADLHTACAWLMIATGAAVVLVELGGGIAAAYGRYAATAPFARWLGPVVPAWFAWMFQESWSVMVPLALLPFSNPACLISPGNLALGGMFLTHYTYRSFVYPLRIRGGKPMPLGISSLAALFCFFNGYLQGRLWTALHVFSLDTAADRAFLACGGAIWLVGWCSHRLHVADTRPPRRLRRNPSRGRRPLHTKARPRAQGHTHGQSRTNRQRRQSERSTRPRNGERESSLHEPTSHVRRRPLKRSHTGRRSSPGTSTCTRTASSAAYAGRARQATRFRAAACLSTSPRQTTSARLWSGPATQSLRGSTSDVSHSRSSRRATLGRARCTTTCGICKSLRTTHATGGRSSRSSGEGVLTFSVYETKPVYIRNCLFGPRPRGQAPFDRH